jgi:ferredoxin
VTEVTITLDGRTETVEHRGGDTILLTARWAGMRVRTSCEAGHCATCMALVVEGRAVMKVNDALDDDEVAEGWVLTCQAVPVTDVVRVVYDP